MAQTARKTYSDKEKAEFKEAARQKLDQYAKGIAEQIIGVIQQGGEGKWIRPWKITGMGLPMNPASQHRYSGGNLLTLYLHMLSNGHTDGRYCSFAQAKTLAADTKIRAGAKGITLLRPFIKEHSEDDATADDEQRIMDGENPSANKRIVFFRPFNVFHASDIENLPALDEAFTPPSWENNDLLDRLMSASGVEVTPGHSDKAAFFPARNVVRMPAKGAFDGKEEYYATLLHEWYHATGHVSREDRKFGNSLTLGGLESYALEELRAESFSVMASAALGLPYQLTSHAAYLASWNKHLQSDPKTIMEEAVKAVRMLEVVMDFAQDKQPKAKWFPDKSTWPAPAASTEMFLAPELVVDDDPWSGLEDESACDFRM